MNATDIVWFYAILSPGLLRFAVDETVQRHAHGSSWQAGPRADPPRPPDLARPPGREANGPVPL